MEEKKVLILAYYFPPFGMGGVQRVLKFAKYLPHFGWKPYVLTVKDVEYWAKDSSLLEELPPEAEVVRTGSFDPLRISFISKNLFKKRKRKDGSARDNAVRVPKIFSWLFFPDTKVGWIPFALMRGLFLCRKEKLDLIFSTSPPPSLHLTAYLLKLITGIPWIADFRDPWIGYKLENFPTPFHLFLKKKMERLIVKKADSVITANPAIKGDFERRHPHAKNICLIDQGYDEEDFGEDRHCSSEIFTIGYLGTFSPDCDPEPIFAALRELFDQKLIPEDNMKFIHVGLSVGIDLDNLIEKYGLKKAFKKKGYLPHRKALDQMKDVSLFLLITSEDPRVFPAKTFEYLPFRRPILEVVPKRSEIAKMILETGLGKVVSTKDHSGIKEALLFYYDEQIKGSLDVNISTQKIKMYERKSLTRKLASIFEEII